MSQNRRIPKDAAVNILTRYINHFEDAELPHYSADVWKDLAKEYNGAWSMHCWWVNVARNRGEILSDARKKMDISVPIPVPLTSVASSEDSDSSFYCSDLERGRGESRFDLKITRDQWLLIKPNHPESSKETSVTNALQPEIWTTLIAEEFYEQFQLPCAYSFKRSEVTKTKHYLKITGYCRAKTCTNKIHGYIDTEPLPSAETITIRITTKDLSREEHEDCKRYLKGKRRKEVGKQAHAEGSSNMLKRLRREKMGRGDPDGPLLPHADVVRHAKKEHINRELGIRENNEDGIQRIYKMQFEKAYMGSIKGIGYNPFYTLYVLPEQISLYNHFREVTGDMSCISIDGTGSIVRKLTRPLNLQSAHIFLHCIVINFNKTVVSIFQILSESQETETFTFALRKWVSGIHMKPKQCVTDYSRALLSACSKAFNNVTIKEYIEICFSLLSGRNPRIEEQIHTYLRVDVAHLIHSICRWDATKKIQRREVRDFFVRCIALMVDCQHLDQFAEIFILTCAVGSHSYEDTVLTLPQTKAVKEAREKLEKYLTIRKINVDGYLETASEEENDENLIFDAEDDVENASNVSNFIRNLLAKATAKIQEGSELNAFYNPQFIKELTRIALEFVLWTAVGVPFLIGHAKSCFCEKNFQDLKTNVLEKYSRRISVEKFLRIHINDLIGATRAMASKLLQFMATGRTLPQLHRKWPDPEHKSIEKNSTMIESSLSDTLMEDSDLLAREDWRGKMGKNIFLQDCQDLDLSAASEAS